VRHRASAAFRTHPRAPGQPHSATRGSHPPNQRSAAIPSGHRGCLAVVAEMDRRANTQVTDGVPRLSKRRSGRVIPPDLRNNELSNDLDCGASNRWRALIRRIGRESSVAGSIVDRTGHKNDPIQRSFQVASMIGRAAHLGRQSLAPFRLQAASGKIAMGQALRSALLQLSATKPACDTAHARFAPDRNGPLLDRNQRLRGRPRHSPRHKLRREMPVPREVGDRT